MMFQVNIMEIPTNLVEYYINNSEENPIDLEKNTIPILYIRRKTSKPYNNTRIYTNNPERLTEYTARGFIIEYKIDKIVDTLIKRGWIIGADNLTMNDFARVYRNLRLMRSNY